MFVVFDVDMEAAALQTSPQALRQAREAARQQAFDAVTVQLKAWGERQGVTVDTAVYTRDRKIDLAGRRYSHMLVEKVSQAAIEEAPDGQRVGTRKWAATAYDTSKPATRTPVKLRSASFLSDGSACFEPPAQPALADCRAAYLALLSQHLRWIDASWGEVAPAADAGR
ncbi:MAG: hypothetical protein RLZZ584_2348 [Pseudomonadota bacterium]